MDIRNCIALVTGANRGLGKAYTESLPAAGVVVQRTQEIGIRMALGAQERGGKRRTAPDHEAMNAAGGSRSRVGPVRRLIG